MSAPARTELQGLGLSASCVDVLRHLWDYLDDEITPAGKARLEAHIATCTQCRAFEGFQSCFLEGLARLRREFDAPNALREKLAQKLKGEGCSCWEKAKRQ